VSAQLQPGSSAPASVSRASVHQCQSVKGQHVAVEFAASECSRCAVSERFRQCWLNFLYSARIAFPCNVDDFRSVLPQRMQVQGVPTTVGSRSRSPPHTRGLSAHDQHVDAIAHGQSASPSTRAHGTPALTEQDNTSSRTAALPQCATGLQDATRCRTRAEWQMAWEAAQICRALYHDGTPVPGIGWSTSLVEDPSLCTVGQCPQGQGVETESGKQSLAEALATAPWRAKTKPRPMAAPVVVPKTPAASWYRNPLKTLPKTPAALWFTNPHVTNIPSTPKLVPKTPADPWFTNPHFTNIPSTPKIAPVARGSVQSCLPTSTSSTANSATDQLTAIEKIEIHAMIRQIYAHVYPEQHDILTMRVGFMTLGHLNPVELYLGICGLHGIKPVPEYSGQRQAARGGLADSQTTPAHRQAQRQAARGGLADSQTTTAHRQAPL